MGEIISQDVSGRLKRSLGHYTDLTSLTSQLDDRAKEHWIDSSKYTTIQDALNDAVAKGLKKVIVPYNTYSVTSTITIPIGIDVDFMGSTLTVPQGFTFNALRITNGSHQKINNLNIVETSHNYTATGFGIYIDGNSDSLTFENIYVQGGNSGIYSAAANTFLNTNIIFKECRCDYASQFGFWFDNTKGLTIDNCFAFNCWYDGFKLRKNVTNLIIKGGESSNNGVSLASGGNGNGIDCYAGGQNFLIDGFITNSNGGSGIYMKTGDLNDQTGELFGSVRNVQIVGVQCRFNTGNGLDINRVNADDATGSTYPLMNHVNVLGGIYDGNLQSGIYARGRNINITSPMCINNKNHGINFANVMDANITSPICTANGQASAGLYHGINLNLSRRINILNPICNGVDGDYITSDADYSSLTKYHKYGIYVAVDCVDGITIKNPKITNSTNAYQLFVGMTTGSCIIEYGSWTLSNAYGSMGSTFVNNGAVYTKKSSTPTDFANGWVMDSLISSSATTPTSGTWSLGNQIQNSAPTPSGNMGWVCTTAGIACGTTWAATTAYTVNQQVFSGTKVYQCTTAGTSGSTAPTSTGTTITDGSVVWKYMGVLAVFKTYGVIGA
jgi:hypothetical protein